MRCEWLNWFSQNADTNTKAPSKQDVYNWFSKSWESLSPHSIVKSFLVSGMLNSLDGKQDLFSTNLLKMKNENITDRL